MSYVGENLSLWHLAPRPNLMVCCNCDTTICCYQLVCSQPPDIRKDCAVKQFGCCAARDFAFPWAELCSLLRVLRQGRGRSKALTRRSYKQEVEMLPQSTIRMPGPEKAWKIQTCWQASPAIFLARPALLRKLKRLLLPAPSRSRQWFRRGCCRCCCCCCQQSHPGQRAAPA